MSCSKFELIQWLDRTGYNHWINKPMKGCGWYRKVKTFYQENFGTSMQEKKKKKMCPRNCTRKLLSVSGEEPRPRDSSRRQEGWPVAWTKEGHSSAWACRKKMVSSSSIRLLSTWGVRALDPVHKIRLRSHQCWGFSGERKGGFVQSGAFICKVARSWSLLGKLSPLLEYSDANSKSPGNNVPL